MLPISLAIGAGAWLAATLTCEPLPAPGRLRCALVAELPAEAGHIEWADALVLRVPGFLQPLRGRLASRDADVQKERLLRWNFALVAKTEGTGELVLRVRAVTCDAAKRCEATEVDVPVNVYVGPALPPGSSAPR